MNQPVPAMGKGIGTAVAVKTCHALAGAAAGAMMGYYIFANAASDEESRLLVWVVSSIVGMVAGLGGGIPGVFWASFLAWFAPRMALDVDVSGQTYLVVAVLAAACGAEIGKGQRSRRRQASESQATNKSSYTPANEKPSKTCERIDRGKIVRAGLIVTIVLALIALVVVLGVGIWRDWQEQLAYRKQFTDLTDNYFTAYQSALVDHTREWEEHLEELHLSEDGEEYKELSEKHKAEWIQNQFMTGKVVFLILPPTGEELPPILSGSPIPEGIELPSRYECERPKVDATILDDIVRSIESESPDETRRQRREFLEQFKPENPDQVETLITLHCRGEKTGSYNDGTHAVQLTLQAILVDISGDRPRIRDCIFWTGSRPPDRTRAGHGWGSEPLDELYAYLQNIRKGRL